MMHMLQVLLMMLTDHGSIDYKRYKDMTLATSITEIAYRPRIFIGHKIYDACY